jgi:hypothetical protein
MVLSLTYSINTSEVIHHTKILQILPREGDTESSWYFSHYVAYYTSPALDYDE